MLTCCVCVFADGPLNVSIAGPDSAQLGSVVSLSCSADSWPGCAFQWTLSGSAPSVFITSAATLTFIATEVSVENITCRAYNPVTSITMFATKSITVVGE